MIPRPKQPLARWVALSILALVTLGALLGPEISHWQADEIDWEAIETPPAASH